MAFNKKQKLNTYVQSTASFYFSFVLSPPFTKSDEWRLFRQLGLPHICKQLNTLFKASSVPVQYSDLSKSEWYHRDDCHLNVCTSFIASMATEQYFPDRTQESAWLIWQTIRYCCEKARRHRWTYYAGMTYAPWVSSAVGFH